MIFSKRLRAGFLAVMAASIAWSPASAQEEKPSLNTLAQAQPLPEPSCAWAFERTPFGLGNWLWPDTANRVWSMPLDPNWQKVTITGVYPKARFFSFAVYDNAPVSTGLSDRLFDAQIMPDLGSVNPFKLAVPTANSAEHPQTYTIAITRTDGVAGNALRLHAELGWLLYRLYLPNAGEGATGGTLLPSISFTDLRGQMAALPACPTVNRHSDLTALQAQLVPSLLESPPLTPPVPDHIWFGPVPAPPARLLPNPDNKDMVSSFLSGYEPGRMIVIRGKMPGFPDTYRGSPALRPAPGFDAVQLRFWSMCLGDLVSPMPINGCATDVATPLDQGGSYTVVISNDLFRPEWLPNGAVWLPWGNEQTVPKAIVLRNTLPSENFSQSVQNAVAKGCGLDFNFTAPPAQDEIAKAGECAQNVMGDTYPVAVWCDRPKFVSGGWQECFRAAGLATERPAEAQPKASSGE